MKRSPGVKGLAFAAAVLAVFAGSHSSLYASGLSMYEQGDPAIGTASVGQTVADDASSAY
ncbi:MAG: hypothetical protein WC352_07720 [Candidatus Omnitrophota bacterium]